MEKVIMHKITKMALKLILLAITMLLYREIIAQESDLTHTISAIQKEFKRINALKLSAKSIV
jgi:hypothetical protein